MRLSNRSFTLMELMLAVVILLVVLTALLATFVYCILLNDSSRNLVIAAGDAQYVLEQIKGLAYGNISSYTPPSFSNLNNEAIALSRNMGTYIGEISVNVTWNERQYQKNFSLTTRVAK